MTQFQSTLSVRRATAFTRIVRDWKGISIHALREESDWQPDSTLCLAFLISIHALREESDKTGNELVELTVLFQSTLSVRRATRSA